MDCPDGAPLQEWVDSLSAKQLKEYIESRGLQYADCLEKVDLRKRALEAACVTKNRPQTSSDQTSKTTQHVQKVFKVSVKQDLVFCF